MLLYLESFCGTFYNNMKDENGRNDFYKLQDEVIKNGQDYYLELLGKNKINITTHQVVEF